MTRIRTQIAALLILTPVPAVLAAETKITSPKDQFGFNIGDAYQLVNFTRMAEYWKKFDQESDRLTVVDIGKTAEGRTMQGHLHAHRRIGGTSCLIHGEDSGSDCRQPPCMPFLGFGQSQIMSAEMPAPQFETHPTTETRRELRLSVTPRPHCKWLRLAKTPA